MRIRKASLTDAESLALIYNQGIEERIATLETRLRTTEERKLWLKQRDKRHPVFVVEKENEIIGWASLNIFNTREVYNYVADISVYVRRDNRKKGFGKLLVNKLEESAKELGYHKLVLICLPKNKAACLLYKSAKFHVVGTYREQGILDGKWVSVQIWEKILT